MVMGMMDVDVDVDEDDWGDDGIEDLPTGGLQTTIFEIGDAAVAMSMEDLLVLLGSTLVDDSLAEGHH